MGENYYTYFLKIILYYITIKTEENPAVPQRVSHVMFHYLDREYASHWSWGTTSDKRSSVATLHLTAAQDLKNANHSQSAKKR